MTRVSVLSAVGAVVNELWSTGSQLKKKGVGRRPEVPHLEDGEEIVGLSVYISAHGEGPADRWRLSAR